MHLTLRKLLIVPLLISLLPVMAQQQTKTDHGFLLREQKKLQKEKKRDSVLRRFLNDNCYCANPSQCDPTKYYYQGQQFLSTYTMNRLIRQDISKITLDQQGNPVIGNYASLQYAENNTKITLNTSFYNPFYKRHWETDPIRSILSVNVKAGISDGVSSLFANKNASSGTSVTLKYSFISPKTVYERYSMTDCGDLKTYRDYLLTNYDSLANNALIMPYSKRQDLLDKMNKAAKLLAAHDSAQRPAAIAVRRDSLKLLALDIAKERHLLPVTLAAILKDTSRTIEEREKLHAATKEIKLRDLSVKERQITSAFAGIDKPDTTAISHKRYALLAAFVNAQVDYRTYETTVSRYDRNAAIDDTYALLYAIETKDVKWDYYKVKWFDLDGTIGGDKYQVFDRSMPVGQQLSPKPFTSWSGGFTFNYFESGDPGKFLKNGYFLQWGFHLSNTNNLIGASTVDVTTTDSYDSGNKETTATVKKSAYRAPFIESYLRSLNFRFSSYQDAKHGSSLNFYSTLGLPFDKNVLKVDKRPDVLLGTGYTLAFLDKDKAKSVINVELFLNFSDILNSAGDDNKFYQRHQVGLRIGVPFNSIFINK